MVHPIIMVGATSSSVTCCRAILLLWATGTNPDTTADKSKRIKLDSLAILELKRFVSYTSAINSKIYGIVQFTFHLDDGKEGLTHRRPLRVRNDFKREKWSLKE